MAGKRQHYIWQMLQRGFSVAESGDNHIWVYKKGAEPERTVSRKFGQIKNFYGPPGAAADKNITLFENAVQSFIQDARGFTDGQRLDSDIPAALVAHLEMRSLFLRDELSLLAERVLNALKSHLASPRSYSAILLSYLKNHPEMIDAELDKAGVQTEIQVPIREFLITAAPKLIGRSAEAANEQFLPFLDTIIATLAETAKSAHNKSLEKDFFTIERTNLYSGLQFSVVRPATASLILPDTSLVFFKRNGCAPFSTKDDLIEAVLVPISVDAAIIGKSYRLFHRDPPTIQRALASCAYNSFIHPQKSPHLVKLSKLISRNARLLTEAEIRSIGSLDALLTI